MTSAVKALISLHNADIPGVLWEMGLLFALDFSAICAKEDKFYDFSLLPLIPLEKKSPWEEILSLLIKKVRAF